MAEKLLLALDTTGDTFSVALRCGGQELGEYCGGSPRQHLTEFYAVLEELLQAQGAQLKEVAAVAITTGPGSFTGVRLGVLIARTIGQVLNCPIIPVNAQEAIATHVHGHFHEGVLVVALDARKSEILSASFQLGGSPQWREPAKLLSLTQWAEAIPQGARVAGNALVRYGEELARLRPDVRQLPPEFSRVRASSVAQLGALAWRQRLTVQWSRLLPDYTRPADVQVH